MYLQNSVVCLEDDWKKMFKFVSDSSEKINEWVKGIEKNEKYECDDPILKL
jgi:hypothetical protein